MSHVSREPAAALERWREAGLVSSEQAEALRAEAHAGGRRGFQYVLAATGGVIVLIAAGMLADWAWPRLCAAWYFGVDRGGVLGTVGALAATAALLFWLSARLGRSPSAPPSERGDAAAARL